MHDAPAFRGWQDQHNPHANASLPIRRPPNDALHPCWICAAAATSHIVSRCAASRQHMQRLNQWCVRCTGLLPAPRFLRPESTYQCCTALANMLPSPLSTHFQSNHQHDQQEQHDRTACLNNAATCQLGPTSHGDPRRRTHLHAIDEKVSSAFTACKFDAAFPAAFTTAFAKYI